MSAKVPRLVDDEWAVGEGDRRSSSVDPINTAPSVNATRIATPTMTQTDRIRDVSGHPIRGKSPADSCGVASTSAAIWVMRPWGAPRPACSASIRSTRASVSFLERHLASHRGASPSTSRARWSATRASYKRDLAVPIGIPRACAIEASGS